VCINQNAIDLLKNNIDKINSSTVYCNPNFINLIETELKEEFAGNFLIIKQIYISLCIFVRGIKTKWYNNVNHCVL